MLQQSRYQSMPISIHSKAKSFACSRSPARVAGSRLPWRHKIDRPSHVCQIAVDRSQLLHSNSAPRASDLSSASSLQDAPVEVVVHADPGWPPAVAATTIAASPSQSIPLCPADHTPNRQQHQAGIISDLDAVNPAYNKPGLNGLAVGSTMGLETGCFTVTSQLPVQYTVQQVDGILDLNNKALLRGVVHRSWPCTLGPEPDNPAGLRRLVVIDENVHQLYGQRLRRYFDHHGVEAHLLPLPTCEENKDLQLVTTIADAIEDFKINRRQEPIIAIGGGVCLDVTGLAANLYRRNTCIIKVPTTLMAVVDASVGVKTAVNFHDKKNKLGTYQPPLGVLYDTAFLSTLESRHISNGAAEVLKMACIKDADLFELLDDAANENVIGGKFQGPSADTIIRRSIQGMLEELEYNLWESILVRLVDYGHTISPELEMAALRSSQMLLHGEAVAIDMALSTELAYGRGLLTGEQRLRVLNLLMKLQLPLWHECCSVDLLMKGLDDMTRARDGLQRVPLMHGIGAATFVYDIMREEMSGAAQRLLSFAAAHGDAAAVKVLAGSSSADVAGVRGESGSTGSNNVVPFPLSPVPLPTAVPVADAAPAGL